MTLTPMRLWNDRVDRAGKHNLSLKIALLNSLKDRKLKAYKADPILRTNIPKYSALRALCIPTLKDRCLQMLLKIIMEPYLEPLGDPSSFGFRPGRSCHMALASLASHLRWLRGGGRARKRSANFRPKGYDYREDLNKNKTRLPRRGSLYIIKADILKCFDLISHSWLISHTPMPFGVRSFAPPDTRSGSCATLQRLRPGGPEYREAF